MGSLDFVVAGIAVFVSTLAVLDFVSKWMERPRVERTVGGYRIHRSVRRF